MANHREYRVMSATVDASLLERVHEQAQIEDRSVASVVRRALAKYLDESASAAELEQAKRS